MSLKPVTIIGGGLAGLTLGIALRRKGIPVTVREAGHYPRHRVCGEFISGRGQEVLDQAGLLQLLVKAGAVSAETAVFFFGKYESPPRAVRPAALCLSRLKLDALLANEFQVCGGVLRQDAPFRGPCAGEGFVRASGRRVRPTENGWRWFGLKAHARNVELSADMEMFCLPDQYVGVCRIEDGKVNVCGLFRRRVPDHRAARSGRDLLRGTPGTALHERLRYAEFMEETFCAVAGLPLKRQRASGRDECIIGDALSMIPPFTGNGISMAFESAAAAAGPVAAYSRGECSWEEARRAVACGCDRAFDRRLRWGAWLQRLLFLRWLPGRCGSLMLHSEFVWRVLFSKTR